MCTLGSLLDTSPSQAEIDHRARQALATWGIYLLITSLLNGTIPFLLGYDQRGWTYSPLKEVLVNLCVYSGLFLAVPLILTKGWATVRQPGFWIPLLVATLAMTLRTFYRPTAVLAVIAIGYLHWRFDLSELGIRSKGWRGDLIAIMLLCMLYSIPSLWQARTGFSSLTNALQSWLDRLFTNPASTVENLFYFGFLTERLSFKTGRWLTPVLIGLMYMLHEMTNPEFWYEGMRFFLVWGGVAMVAIVYLWRRSVVVIWLGDGLGRLLSRLF